MDTTPTTMRAIEITTLDGPSSVELAHVNRPVPEGDQVLIEVRRRPVHPGHPETAPRSA